MLLWSLPGGGSGIGRAACQRLASEGASVVVADISEVSANETLRSLPSDLRSQGHMAAVVDVSSKQSVKKLVTSIQVLDVRMSSSPSLQMHYFQPPSVCVNAAGITQDDFLLNMEEDQFDRVIQVNLKVRTCDTLGGLQHTSEIRGSAVFGLGSGFLVSQSCFLKRVDQRTPQG